MIAELGLVVLPNLILPLLLLRYAWPVPVVSLRHALGWQRDAWRPLIVGSAMFILYLMLSALLTGTLGPGIPYSLPGEGGAVTGPAALLALLVFVVLVALTVLGEEAMFRGLIQTQVGKHYGAWAAMALTIVLFGLRHLPADLFYAQAWNATPAMWVSRQVDLYLGALCLSLARHVGRSTWASATTHLLVFVHILVSGFL